MKTRNNSFIRVISLGLALCLIVGLIWLPSKQNHTHAAQPSESTAPVGDTIVFSEDFADGIAGWTQVDQGEFNWTAPNKHAVLTTTDANDARIQNKVQRTWDGLYARSYYWGMDYTFDAKMDGVKMGVTMYARFYGTNTSGVNDGNNTHTRLANMLIDADGYIYKDLVATEGNKIGRINTTEYDLTEWHTYTFRWVKATANGGNYYIWLYIDGEFVPYNDGVTMGSQNGGSGDYFAIKIEDSIGTLEIDNVKQTAANFSGSGYDGTTVTAGSITYNTDKGQPDTFFSDNFESGIVSDEKWTDQSVDNGATIKVVDTYDNNTGFVKLPNASSQTGRYHNSPAWTNMIPINAVGYTSIDANLGGNGAVQFRFDLLRGTDVAADGNVSAVYSNHVLRGGSAPGLYNSGGTKLVDLSDVDMTKWHTYTFKMDPVAGNMTMYVDGVVRGTQIDLLGHAYHSSNSSGFYNVNDQYRYRFQTTVNPAAYNAGLTGYVEIDNIVVSYDAWNADRELAVTANGNQPYTVSWSAADFASNISCGDGATRIYYATQAELVATYSNFTNDAYDVYVNGEKVASAIKTLSWTSLEAIDCTDEEIVVKVVPAGAMASSVGLTTTVKADHVKGTPVIENETGSTCKDPGTYDEVYYCTICGEEISRDNKVKNELSACTPGTAVTENMVPATCTEEGTYDKVVYCTVCGEELSREQMTLEVKPHSLVIDEAKAPTCTETGLTEGYHCQYCGKVYVAQEVIPVVDHTPGDVTIENVVGATCSAVGTYDEAVYCTECGKELSREHKTTEKLPHTPVTDKAVAPSCTETGLTEGSHCDVCGEVFVAQEVVPVVEHTAGEAVVENTVGATCGAAGTYDEVTYCTVCGKELSRIQKTTEKLPHTPVTDAAVAAGCETTGLTEGSHCGVCGEVLVAQEEVPAAGHTNGAPVQENVNGATCGATGSYEEVVYCSVCSKELSREQKTTEKLPHTSVTDAAVAAGCETTGLTEGSHCGVCGEVLVAQEEVPAMGHSYDNEYDTTCNNEGCTTGDREGPAQTGDASIIALAAMMLPASGIGLGALCIKRKKEN